MYRDANIIIYNSLEKVSTSTNMEKKKKMELPGLIAYTRGLLVVALLRTEDKANCLQRILKIEYMTDYEKELWHKLELILENTGTVTKADIVKVFGFNRMDNEIVNKLVDCNVDDEIDIYISNYEKVMKKWRLIASLHDYRNKLIGCEKLDTDDLIDKLNDNSSEKSINMDVLNNLESIYDEEVDKTKISTCIKKIDDLNASFRKGTVNAIMGYTGSYKTLYCTNVSYESIKNELNVCYVSLEISKAEMYYNFLSRYSNEKEFNRPLCHTDMKFKELSEEDKNYLFNTITPRFKDKLAKHLVIIDETDFNSNTSSTFDNLFRNVERSFIETTGRGVDLVIIDHLNLLKFSDSNGMNDYSKVNHWMSYFRRNCKNFIRKHKQVCILVAVQSSREGYEKAKIKGGSYSLTGAAEGNEIERSSENVLAIYSDSDLKEQQQAKLQIIKGRNCGEMNEPILISVDPKYYIVSDYEETIKSDNDDVIDVSTVNKQESDNNIDTSNITYETLEKMGKPVLSSKLKMTSEKREVLRNLGVNFDDNDVEEI